MSVVTSILPAKPKVEDRLRLLSEIFSLFVTEHSPNWTAKTKQEFEKQFGVMLEIQKDVRIDAYDQARNIIKEE